MSNSRFIELSSSYRNRIEYPQPASFEVPFSPSQARNQYEQSKGAYKDSNGVLHKIISLHATQSDTITNGIIEYLWNTTNSTYPSGLISSISNYCVTVTSILSPVLNFYVGYQMNFSPGSSSSIISSYDPTTATFTLLSPPPLASTSFTISDPSTTTSFTLPAIDQNGKTILSYRQCYNNYYIIDETLSTFSTIIYSKIVSYDIFTRSATLETPLTLQHEYSLRKTLQSETYTTINIPSLSGIITQQLNPTTIKVTGLTSTSNYNCFEIIINNTIISTISTYNSVTLQIILNSPIDLSTLPPFPTFTINTIFTKLENYPQLSITSNCIFLPPTANQTDNYYTGKYIYVYPSPGINIEGSCFYIQSYIGNGYNACFLTTVNTPDVKGATSKYPSYDNMTIAIPPPGTTINIVTFSKDNYTPLIYNGSVVSQQETVAYEISLLSLNLPNITLTTGSNIAFYPYVYVEFCVINKQAPNIIYSNNPNSNRALFLVTIRDIKDKRITPFIKLNGRSMIQTVKFKPNDCLRFSVFLPNGTLFQTIMSDYYSPSAPNPFVQIDALFGIDRLG